MRHHIRSSLTAIAVVVTWLLAARELESNQPALGVIMLAPFVAPGAVIGISLGWLSHAFVRDDFTWARGRAAAILGALLLPPWLAVLVAMTGMTVAGGMAMVVGGAWVIFFVGLGIAAARWASARLTRSELLERLHSTTRFGRRWRASHTAGRSSRRAVEMFDRGVLTRKDVEG